MSNLALLLLRCLIFIHFASAISCCSIWQWNALTTTFLKDSKCGGRLFLLFNHLIGSCLLSLCNWFAAVQIYVFMLIFIVWYVTMQQFFEASIHDNWAYRFMLRYKETKYIFCLIIRNQLYLIHVKMIMHLSCWNFFVKQVSASIGNLGWQCHTLMYGYFLVGCLVVHHCSLFKDTFT